MPAISDPQSLLQKNLYHCHGYDIYNALCVPYLRTNKSYNCILNIACIDEKGNS
jgi:hypothetical protein